MLNQPANSARGMDLLRKLMDGRAGRQGGTRRRQVVEAPDAPVPQPLEGLLPGGAHAVEQRGVEGAPHSVELRATQQNVTYRPGYPQYTAIVFEPSGIDVRLAKCCSSGAEAMQKNP